MGEASNYDLEKVLQRGRDVREELGLMTDELYTAHLVAGCRRCLQADRLGVREQHEVVS